MSKVHLNHKICLRSLFCLISMILSVMFYGCEEHLDRDKKYIFIGDSLITRWPLDETFPSQIVYNHGKSGSGIEYLEENRNRFLGQNVVVISGTNDYKLFYSDELNNYSDSYLEVISNLTDKTIYLFSVLPRDFKGDPTDINLKIQEFNELIESKISDFPKIIYINVFNDFLYKDKINYQYYYDGLHINSYGYEILTEKLLKLI